MKLAINQAVLFSASTDTFLNLCQEYDIQSIEFRVPKLKEWLYANSKTEARRKLSSLGIKVAAVNSLDDFGLVPRENLKILKSETEFVAHLCEAIECELVIAPVGRWFNTIRAKEEVASKTLERLELINNILDPYGIKVGVEPISFPEFSIQTIQEADEICQLSGNSANGLVVDYYNLFQGGMRPGDFPVLKSPVHIIHVNDADILPSKNLDVASTRAFPGDGTINSLEWTVEAIKSGYDGVFSLETFPKDLWEMDPQAAMFKAVGKLKKFRDQVTSQL